MNFVKNQFGTVKKKILGSGVHLCYEIGLNQKAPVTSTNKRLP